MDTIKRLVSVDGAPAMEGTHQMILVVIHWIFESAMANQDVRLLVRKKWGHSLEADMADLGSKPSLHDLHRFKNGNEKNLEIRSRALG